MQKDAQWIKDHENVSQRHDAKLLQRSGREEIIDRYVHAEPNVEVKKYDVVPELKFRREVVQVEENIQHAQAGEVKSDRKG